MPATTRTNTRPATFRDQALLLIVALLSFSFLLRRGRGSDIVCGVSILANEFDQVRVHHETLGHLDGPRLGIGLRIVDGDLDFEGSEIGTAKLLRYLRSLCERAALNVEPLRIGIQESSGLDHKRVPFPLAD